EGCAYYELETLIKRVDADINGYSSQTVWINRSRLSEFLDKGFLIVLNTNQGGGHYILIGGWDGSAVYPDKRFYYIWDSWKIPLGLDSTEIQYVRDLAGNKASRGSANDILVYKIAAPVLNNIFKDQIGDGTMLAFKFVPDNLPPQALAVQSKGIFAASENVLKEGSEIFTNEMSKHNITDIFLQTRQTDGCLNTEVLDEIIPLAHKRNIKVHAWVPVLKDESLQNNLKEYANGEWANLKDTIYMKHVLDDIITPLCKYEIDGIYLDCLFLPVGANVYTGDQKFIDAYYGAIRKLMDKSGKAFASLGAAMIPEGEPGSLPDGQCVFRASQYLNFIVPLLYTHDYLEGPSWTGEQTKYYANSISSTCQVLAGLQTLDNYGNYASSLEVRQCADYAIDGGASGIVCSCYPLANWQWEILDHIKIEHK
ncbi:MAG TPA: hypothetical protein VHP30_12845, partial [Ignavibacteriales bacterium]|nr:hypothetical protein [Ignavibacteriales bacterium]